MTLTERQKFILDNWETVYNISMQNGVNPWVAMAQFIIESDNGKKAIKGNYSGTKANQGWIDGMVAKYGGNPEDYYTVADTVEYINGVKIPTTSRFRKYPNFNEAVGGYAQSILEQSEWSKTKGMTGYEDVANVIGIMQGTEGKKYATDPEYVGKVIDVARQVYNVVPEQYKQGDKNKPKPSIPTQTQATQKPMVAQTTTPKVTTTATTPKVTATTTTPTQQSKPSQTPSNTSTTTGGGFSLEAGKVEGAPYLPQQNTQNQVSQNPTTQKPIATPTTQTSPIKSTQSATPQKTNDEIFESKLEDIEEVGSPLPKNTTIADTNVDLGKNNTQNSQINYPNFSLEAEKVEGAPYRTDGKPQIPNISPADRGILSAQTEYRSQPTQSEIANFSLEEEKNNSVPYRTDQTPKIEGISDIDRGILSAQTEYRNMRAASEKARNEAIDWMDKGVNTQNGIDISDEEEAKVNKTIQDWNNRKTYDPTNKPAQTEEEIIAEIESENPVYETIGDRLRSSYGNDVNVQLGSDGKYYTGEGENPIQISAGSINTTYKDANGVEKQTKSDVYRLADGTYAYEDGNGNIQTLTEAQYQQAKQPVDDNARKSQSFREEAFRWLKDNPNATDSEMWVYLADKLGKNAYAKEQGLKFGNLFNWKNVVGKLREDFNAEQQRKLQQEQTISNELWNRDARGNLIEGGIVSIVGGKPKTIGDVNSLRRDLISFNEDATPEEKAALLNKHLPADRQITANEANTITDLRSAYNLLKTKGGDEFEEYMELGGVELDADGNVKVQKPIDNLEEYLSEYNTKEKEKLELDRAKAKRNLELRMEAFRDIAKNISNTIGVSMGANSLGVDNDNIYKNIEDKYRQKVLAYEAKMEQMRQEKMAEKQRKEAMALQEAQMRAAAQKAAADRELEIWKIIAKMNQTADENEKNRKNKLLYGEILAGKKDKEGDDVFYSDGKSYKVKNYNQHSITITENGRDKQVKIYIPKNAKGIEETIESVLVNMGNEALKKNLESGSEQSALEWSEVQSALSTKSPTPEDYFRVLKDKLTEEAFNTLVENWKLAVGGLYEDENPPTPPIYGDDNEDPNDNM